MVKLPSEQVEEAERREKGIKLAKTFEKIKKSDKKPYSMRLSEKLMNNVEKYTQLMNISKSDLIANLLSDQIKNKILERTSIPFYFYIFYENQSNYAIDYIQSKKYVFLEKEEFEKEEKKLMDYYDDKGYFFIEKIRLNNWFDVWENGTYKAKDKIVSDHTGLIYVNQFTYDAYWIISWNMPEHLGFDLDFQMLDGIVKITEIKEIDKKTAIRLANEKNNLSLARSIEKLEYFATNEIEKDFTDNTKEKVIENLMLENHMLKEELNNLVPRVEKIEDSKREIDKFIKKYRG